LAFLNQIISRRKGIAYAILKKAPVNGLASDNAYKIGAKETTTPPNIAIPIGFWRLENSMLFYIGKPVYEVV
jgi:hypothetical protein